MSSHKGQISFPGGRCHGNEAPLVTALRESWEEIGLKPEDVDVLGQLDDAITLTTSYIIHPFVGVIPYPYQFKVNPNEVDELIEVPVSALKNRNAYSVIESPGLEDKSKYQQLARFYEGRPSMAWFYEYDNHVIWGATARIVKSFLELLSEAEGK